MERGWVSSHGSWEERKKQRRICSGLKWSPSNIQGCWDMANKCAVRMFTWLFLKGILAPDPYTWTLIHSLLTTPVTQTTWQLGPAPPTWLHIPSKGIIPPTKNKQFWRFPQMICGRWDGQGEWEKTAVRWEGPLSPPPIIVNGFWESWSWLWVGSGAKVKDGGWGQPRKGTWGCIWRWRERKKGVWAILTPLKTNVSGLSNPTSIKI